jgi:histidinol dehydrogenase
MLCTPPGRDGQPDATTLAAAFECGVTRVFAVGGAQAIAAMAYGTATIPKVDKIGGPGNLYTVLAMRAVYGSVGIVSLPGPTETLVLCDASANPRFVAADLLAQAEHVQAEPVLLSTSLELIAAVCQEIEGQTDTLPEPNRTWARDSWAARGKIVLADSLEQALELANLYAPEHLCLLVEHPWEVLGAVRNAGGVFVGDDSMEALGDYNAGPSHVMPTGGTARFSSPVNVRDFQKIISVVGLNRPALESLAPAAAQLARNEGLEAHARAIEARLKPD